jgi:hypothetical protein
LQSHFIFSETQINPKKIKRACKPTHKDTATWTDKNTLDKNGQLVTACKRNSESFLSGHRLHAKPLAVIDNYLKSQDFPDVANWPTIENKSTSCKKN